MGQGPIGIGKINIVHGLLEEKWRKYVVEMLNLQFCISLNVFKSEKFTKIFGKYSFLPFRNGVHFQSQIKQIHSLFSIYYFCQFFKSVVFVVFSSQDSFTLEDCQCWYGGEYSEKTIDIWQPKQWFSSHVRNKIAEFITGIHVTVVY